MARYARRGGIFITSLLQKFTNESSSEKNENRLRFDRIMAMSSWPNFFWPTLYVEGGNVTSAGWQVTLCDPIWHVSSRSGVTTLRTAIHLLLTYLLT